MSDERVRAAEFEVERARSRLIGTLNELTGQFEPHRLIEEVWEKAKGKGADLAEEAVDAVRARPFVTTGVVAAITMFLAREPLLDLSHKLIDGVSEKRKSSRRRKTKGKAETEATK